MCMYSPWLNDWKAELEAYRGFSKLDNAIETLESAFRLSMRPEYCENEPKHITNAWLSICKGLATIKHGYNEMMLASETLRHSVPDDLIEQEE